MPELIELMIIDLCDMDLSPGMTSSADMGDVHGLLIKVLFMFINLLHCYSCITNIFCAR